MKIAIMQPYLFPYIGYFQLVNLVDKFIILDDVNFIVKGWINRNRILVNNQPFLFTVPLKKASRNRIIKDIEISDDNDWRQKFLMTIEINYKKAPHFDEVYPLIRDLLIQEETFISKLIVRSIHRINEYLDIETKLVESSSVYNNGHLKAQDKILDICWKEKASYYINPIGGVELYSKISFAEKGIKLNFLKSGEIEYRQFGDEFIPFLSIIDILMFNPKKRVKEFVNNYNLL